MAHILANLNKWIRKFDRWMAVPIMLILLLSILLRETLVGSIFQRFQQFSILFMVISGLYLYLYRQWTVWQRRARTKKDRN
jgi:low temperature requirement protein LtrA